MKKAYLFAALAAAMSLASCSNQELATVSATGEGTVSYTISLPSQLASRAYGEAAKVTDLYYAVYATGTTDVLIEKTLTNVFAPGDLTEDVTINLVTGKTYDLVFWAQSSTATCYTFDADAQTVKVAYTGVENGEETRDAFFAQVKGLKITGPQNETVELYRPFAQLNIGTDDLDKVFPAVTEAQVTVPVYDQLDLMSGAVSNQDGTTEPKDVTFAMAAFPSGQAFPITGYTYMAMNYLLVNTRELVKVEMTTDDSTVDPLVYDNVPVQRNFRTNIYGSLLTTPTNFNVTIDPQFEDPDYNNFISVATAAEMVSALNAGKKNIVLTEDVDLGEVASLPYGILANGTKVAIDLGDNTLDLGPNVARAANKGNLLIKNGTVAITENTSYFYPTGGNIDVENVTVVLDAKYGTYAAANGSIHFTDSKIKVTSPASNKSMVIYSNGGDVYMDNVEVDGGLLAYAKGTTGSVNLNKVTAEVENGPQTQGNVNLTMDGCNISVTKPRAWSTAWGISVFDKSNATITNTTIYCPEGIAVSTNADNPQAVSVVIEDCELTAFNPIMMNVPGTMTVKNTKMTGYEHGFIARGGTITVEDCEITLDTDNQYATEAEAQAAYDLYTGSNTWETGSNVAHALLTLGNRSTSYQYPTDFTFVGTNVLTVKGIGATVFPVVYGYANEGTGLGVTFTYPEATTTFDGLAPVYASENIVVNGTPVTL